MGIQRHRLAQPQRLALDDAGRATGVWGLAGGSLWHYQDGVGWTHPGGGGINTISVGTGPNGTDDVFMQVNGTSMWEYTSRPAGTTSTARSRRCRPSATGVWGLAGGSLWHYQDGVGWIHPGGGGINTISVGTASNGTEEVFMQVNGTSMWEYNVQTGWHNLNGSLSTMVADTTGVWGLAGGSLWHYQDNVGWTHPGGGGINTLAMAIGRQGTDDVFMEVNGTSMWEYNVLTGWPTSTAR